MKTCHLLAGIGSLSLLLTAPPVAVAQNLPLKAAIKRSHSVALYQRDPAGNGWKSKPKKTLTRGKAPHFFEVVEKEGDWLKGGTVQERDAELKLEFLDQKKQKLGSALFGGREINAKGDMACMLPAPLAAALSRYR